MTNQNLEAELQAALDDADRWADEHASASPQSAKWYTLNNPKAFLQSLNNDHSVDGIEKATHALGWHLSDQYGSGEHIEVVANLNERVRRVGKEMAWRKRRL